MKHFETCRYNHGHNILRPFDFSFATSEFGRGCFQWHTWVAPRVAEQLKTQNPRKLGNNKKISKLSEIIAQCPVFFSKRKFYRYFQKITERFSQIFLFRDCLWQQFLPLIRPRPLETWIFWQFLKVQGL